MNLSPLAPYEPADDLWLITTFFNPAGYAKKLAMYQGFAEHVRSSGLRLVTVECAFGDAPFELPEADGVVRVRARDALWQKERLINVALQTLPSACEKIAWVDFDVRFENPSWAVDLSRRLDDFALVQAFRTAVWLPRGATTPHGDERMWTGFGARYAEDRTVAASGDFDAHGHPGFAWGARRQLFARHGVYDTCVVGGGDHLIAHAATGDWTSKCFRWTLGTSTAHYLHFVEWAERFYRDARGLVSYAPGRLLHLWHGEWDDRDYTFRHKGLRGFGFDPASDVRVGAGGCWEWASDKADLHAWTAEYFARRREDGAVEPTDATA